MIIFASNYGEFFDLHCCYRNYGDGTFNFFWWTPAGTYIVLGEKTVHSMSTEEFNKGEKKSFITYSEWQLMQDMGIINVRDNEKPKRTKRGLPVVS